MKRLSVPEQHLVKICKDSLKMPDAMLGVMGGPSKEEARKILSRLVPDKCWCDSPHCTAERE